MPKISSFLEAQSALYAYMRPAVLTGHYKLTTMRALMTALGDPQDAVRAVHIAGTSGKTSTAYYVASLLQGAGYTVGLTVSPHIDTIGERAQINLQSLPEQDYCAELSEFLNIVDNTDLQPTYFEVLVAFAYWLFAKRNVDYMVVEVGLGGLLDGTNVITRDDKTCVITDIGLDHTEILGDTLGEIAAQKAGIILPANHVFIHQQSGEVMQAITADNLHIVESQEVTSTTLPHFQRRNLHLAIATVEYLLSRSLDGDELTQAERTYIPARLEVVTYLGNEVIMDGSHNEQKVSALVRDVRERFADKSMTILLSLGNNKTREVLPVLEQLRSLSDSIVVTTFTLYQDAQRAAIDPAAIAELCRQVGFASVEIEPDPKLALERALEDETVVVTGSYFLLNHIRPVVMGRV